MLVLGIEWRNDDIEYVQGFVILHDGFVPDSGWNKDGFSRGEWLQCVVDF